MKDEIYDDMEKRLWLVIFLLLSLMILGVIVFGVISFNNYFMEMSRNCIRECIEINKLAGELVCMC